MDLEALHLATKAKQEWDTDELCIDIFMEPGGHPILTVQRQLISYHGSLLLFIHISIKGKV